VLEDLADGEGVCHERDDAHGLAAAGAEQRIHLVDLRDQPRPPRRAALAGQLRGDRARV
jgi:hypothetical protein